MTTRPQHRVLLTAAQTHRLMQLAGVEVGPGSPLRHLEGAASAATGQRTVRMGNTDQSLRDERLLRPDGTVNSLAAAALTAAARPEEVVSVAVADRAATGFSLVRRGGAVAECTVSQDRVKLVFPLDRNTTLVGLMGMLSGPSPDQRAGFRFRGTAAQVLVLSCVIGLRERTGSDPTVDEVRAAVAVRRSSPLAMGLDMSTRLGEATSLFPGDVDEVIATLVDAGVVAVLDRVYMSPPLMAITKHPASASFAISRTEVEPGRLRTLQMTVTRVGPYRLMFRQLGGSRFEWRDVTQAELRRWVALMWLTAEERRLVMG